MTTSCITDQRNHALNRWGALGTADNWSTLDTRNMSRIVFRLFAVASKHTASRSAGRTPGFVRSLSSSQGGVPLFFFDTSLYAASLWLLHVHNAEIFPQIIESNQLQWTCNYQRSFNNPSELCYFNFRKTKLNLINLNSFHRFPANSSWLLIHWFNLILGLVSCWMERLSSCRQVLPDPLWWHYRLAEETDPWAVCSHQRERHWAGEFCVSPHCDLLTLIHVCVIELG